MVFSELCTISLENFWSGELMPLWKVNNKISNLKFDFISKEIMPEYKAEKALILFSWRTTNQQWVDHQYVLE
jgi:hypothetical protein